MLELKHNKKTEAIAIHLPPSPHDHFTVDALVIISSGIISLFRVIRVHSLIALIHILTKTQELCN